MTPPQCPDFILAETTDGLILSYRGEEFTVDDDMRKDLIAYLEIQSRRDTVLELLRLKYVEFLNHPCPELADKYDHCCDAEWCGLCTLDEVLAELRRAGEP